MLKVAFVSNVSHVYVPPPVSVWAFFSKMSPPMCWTSKMRTCSKKEEKLKNKDDLKNKANLKEEDNLKIKTT